MPAQLTNLRPRLKTVSTVTAKPATKTTDPYYHTPQHRRWRYVVMQRAGWACQGCGAQSTPQARVTLYADHIAELSDGGAPLDPANGQALCGGCHQQKSADQRKARAQHEKV